ncbi:hypothetical protein NI390_05605 [Vibrio fluvialis]|uniref:hypothetical protein n=1 Tax=Vibrio fluvialis TaxID=676 RepID=UPI0027E4D5E1|nr:hypothetical protein [Vibrio fluvialis]WMN56479.1 hypothetical protein NI390_05605 [Vibrio fluvialis]
MDVKFVETPQKIAQGTPDAPLISGESRKVRKLPSVKPSVVDVNVPVATMTTIADPSEAVQLTIVPPEDQLTLTDNDFVVSQNDPNAIKKRVLRKPSGMLRMETALFLMVIRKKGGLPQSALCQVN